MERNSIDSKIVPFLVCYYISFLLCQISECIITTPFISLLSLFFNEMSQTVYSSTKFYTCICIVIPMALWSEKTGVHV